MKPTEKIKLKLKAVEYYTQAIDADHDKITKLRSQAERITPTYSLAPGGHPSASMADSVEMIVCVEAKLKKHSLKMHDAMLLAMAMIDSLPDYRQRIVLQYRYINFYSWGQIVQKLHYERRWVMRLHGQALLYLSKQATKSHI